MARFQRLVESDPRTGRAYVYWRTRVNPQNTGFRGMELTEDCTDVKPQSDTQLFQTPNREAHAGRLLICVRHP